MAQSGLDEFVRRDARDALANARGDLEAVVEKTPARWEAHLILRRIYGKQERWDLAVGAYGKVAGAEDPDAPSVELELEQARVSLPPTPA